MDFSLSEEQAMLQRSAADFALRLRAETRQIEKAGVSAALRQSYAGLGMAFADWPEAANGAGLAALDKTILLEELGFGCLGASVALDLPYLAWSPLVWAGAGEHVDLERAATLLVDLEGGLTLSGEAVQGKGIVVLGKPDTLVILRPDRLLVLNDHFQREDILPLALHACGVSRLTIDGNAALSLPLDAATFRRILAKTRLWVAALTLGATRAAYDYARHYATERMAFGRPIAHHQAMAFELADHRVALEAMQTLLLAAAAEDDELAVTQAYLEIVETCPAQTVASVQQLGAHGFVKDHLVEKWMRETRAMAMLFGGADAARADLADLAPDGLGGVAMFA